jgi:hypothetical protein
MYVQDPIRPLSAILPVWQGILSMIISMRKRIEDEEDQ